MPSQTVPYKEGDWPLMEQLWQERFNEPGVAVSLKDRQQKTTEKKIGVVLNQKYLGSVNIVKCPGKFKTRASHLPSKYSYHWDTLSVPLWKSFLEDYQVGGTRETAPCSTSVIYNISVWQLIASKWSHIGSCRFELLRRIRRLDVYTCTVHTAIINPATAKFYSLFTF